VAYIGLDSLSDGMVGSAIGSILLADLASVAGDRYNYGVNNWPVNIFVDEAAEVINDPVHPTAEQGPRGEVQAVHRHPDLRRLLGAYRLRAQSPPDPGQRQQPHRPAPSSSSVNQEGNSMRVIAIKFGQYLELEFKASVMQGSPIVRPIDVARQRGWQRAGAGHGS
jgi:hypothetical protein